MPPSVAALPQVVVSDEAHAPEHSIEVHVPFLQRLLPQADLVPLAVGRATPSEVADVVDALLDDSATVVVISSDLSHYLPYDAARRLDRDTIDQVTALRGDLDHEQACGATPINGLMEHARRRGGTIRALASCSSGDTAGDRDRVVGYAALALEEKAFEETLVRGTLEVLALFDKPDPLDGPTRERWLLDDGASFVTLHLDRRLRGCIGTLTAYRPLLDDVRANAVAAASTDPRFPPVGPDEAPHLAIEVSVLSVPEPIQVTSERDAVLALRPRVDGVVLEAAGRRATYLPQVWDQLTDPLDFLRSLRAKAGLPRDHWDDGVRLSRYSVTSFEEEP